MGKSTISMAMFYVANCKRLPAGMFVDEVPKKPQKSPNAKVPIDPHKMVGLKNPFLLVNFSMILIIPFS